MPEQMPGAGRVAAAVLRRAGVLLLLACASWSAAPAQESAVTNDATPVFGTTVVVPGGLRGDIYLLPPGTARLPNFSLIRPVGTIYTSSLDVSPRPFHFGFPGVTDRFEWFAIDYTGRFWIGRPGEYGFELSSDDGTRLYIDDSLVIENDGIHPVQTRSSRVVLQCGIHTIRLSYFQGPRTMVALALKIKPPDEKSRIFNTDDFRPPSNPDDWVCGGTAESATAAGRRRLRDVVADERIAEQALEVLKSRPVPEEFPFKTAVFHFPGENPQSALAFEVMGRDIQATPARGTTHRLRISVAAFVRDSSGRIVDRYITDAPLSVDEANLEAAKASPITFTHPLNMPPGRYTLEAVMVDREARKTSVRTLPFEAPATGPGLAVSTMALVQRVEPAAAGSVGRDPFVFRGNRVLPSMSPEVPLASQPHAYFMIYPDRTVAEKPQLRVEFLARGKVSGTFTPDLPAPDESGDVPVVLSSGKVPGDCELRVTVIQGAQSVTRSLKYTVVAN